MIFPAAVVDTNSAEFLLCKRFVLQPAAVAATSVAFIVQGAQVLTGGAHAEGPSGTFLQDLLQHGP